MNSEKVIETLRHRHEVLYQVISLLCDRGFEFNRVTYDSDFDGYFELLFSRVINPESEPPWKRQFFKLSRDPRDPIVDLSELLPTGQDNPKNGYKEIASARFNADAWATGVLEATKQLIEGIKEG